MQNIKLFRTIEIEISSPCNLRCKTCPNGANSRPYGELPLSVIKDITLKLEDIEYTGVFSPHFYNEPLLDKRLIEILSFARAHLPRAKIFLFTNFTLMTVTLFRKLLPLVNRFIVTIDEPVIKKAVDSITKNLNQDELKMIHKRSILTNNSFSNRAGAVSLNSCRMKRLTTCFFSKDYMTIDAFGDVHLCCNDYHGEAVYGNVLERNFLDIWFSPDYSTAREEGFQSAHPLCEKCKWGKWNDLIGEL